MDESRQKKKEEKRMAGGVRWSNEQSPKCFIEERKEGFTLLWFLVLWRRSAEGSR